MRRTRLNRWLGAILFIVLGRQAVAGAEAPPSDGSWWSKFSLSSLWTNEPKLKPAPHPEELAVPPDDPRFSKPMVYPKGTLNQGLKKDKKEKDPMGGPGGPGSFGAGSGGMRPY